MAIRWQDSARGIYFLCKWTPDQRAIETVIFGAPQRTENWNFLFDKYQCSTVGPVPSLPAYRDRAPRRSPIIG